MDACERMESCREHQQRHRGPACSTLQWAVKEEKEDGIGVKVGWRTGEGCAGEHKDQLAVPSLPIPWCQAELLVSASHPLPTPPAKQTANPESRSPEGLFAFQPGDTALGSPKPPTRSSSPTARVWGEDKVGRRLARAERCKQQWQRARGTATQGLSSTGDAECGHVGNLGRMWPGSAIHQFSPGKHI